MDIKKITHLPYKLFIAKPSGLKPTPHDPRDFKTEKLGWSLFGYTPKFQSHIINTLEVKNQSFNTCQWNATITQKENDENLLLSVRALVAYGKKNGMISGDGFSNLRDGQKALNAWGAAEESLLAEVGGDWYEYSTVNILPLTANANKHKTASYWSVSSRDDILKLLDEGHILTTGIDWYTGFNQGGGFKAPWIIEKPVGYTVGGHAIAIIGYNLNYNGRKVYVIQNSYGSSWGDNGRFYIEMSYLERNNYGVWTNLDIQVDIASFLNQYDGQNVKGSGSTIYFIQKGVKKAYPNWLTYLAYNGKVKGFTIVDDEVLNKVIQGDNMDIEKSLVWDFLKDVKPDQQLEALYVYLYNHT